MKYAVASFGDSAMYSYVNSFWLFYMTTVSGIPPATAGTITAIGVVAHAVAGPFFAGWSDRSRHKLGRRRSFILFSALPIGFSLCMMFAQLPFEGLLKVAALVVFGSAFYMLFAAFFIPHLAWGAEIATGYHERTTIRTLAFVMYSVGFFLGSVMPTLTVEKFGESGMSAAASWSLTTVIVAVISVAAILFTAITIREKPPAHGRPNTKFSLKILAFDYWQALKLRPLRLLIIATIAYMVTNALFAADRMYLFTFKMGYSGALISALMLLLGVLSIVLAFPMMKLAKRFDKRTMLIACFGLTAIPIFIMRFVEITNLPLVLLLLCLIGVASVSYWQLIPATFYDICEVDEYENHVKRAGTITSTMSIAESLGSAIGIQILGLRLQFGGFVSGAATQSASAINAILDCFTIIPGIMLIIAAVAMFRFPITKQKFEAIKKELNERGKSEE
jgi:GPH family glycoside/pentoside/hexuronide:cation symporter